MDESVLLTTASEVPVKRTTLLLAIALATSFVAGCSSTSDDNSSSAKETTTTTTAEATSTTAAESTGDLPSYDTAKEVYLTQADDTTKASCAEDEEDKDVNVSSGTYTRLMCGQVGRFEYIEGADNYAENWPTISSEEVYRSVFHVPGELIVVPIGSNDDFAPALAAECGCGEVLEQQG